MKEKWLKVGIEKRMRMEEKGEQVFRVNRDQVHHDIK